MTDCKKKSSLIHRLINAVVYFFCFSLFLMVITCSVARNALSENTMTSVVASVNLNSEDTTIDDWIYHYMQEHYEDYLLVFRITPYAIGRIMDETNFSDFVKQKLIDYANDLKEGTGTGVMTSDDFMDFVEENESVISRATGRYYIEGELDKIREYLATLDMFDDISASAVCDKIGFPMRYLNIILSDSAITVLFISLCCCLIFLYFFNKKRISCPLLCASISLVVIGILYHFLKFVFQLLAMKVAHRIGIGASLVTGISSPISFIITLVSCITCILGLIGIMCYNIPNMKSAKKLSKQEQCLVEAQEE